MRERHGMLVSKGRSLLLIIAPNRVFEKVSGAGCTQSNTKKKVDKSFHELFCKVFI